MASPVPARYLPDDTVSYLEQGYCDAFKFFQTHCRGHTFTSAEEALPHPREGCPPVRGGDQCSLCLQHFFEVEKQKQYEDRHNNQIVITTACQHVYHHKCFFPWIGHGNTCPDCRAFWYHSEMQRKACDDIDDLLVRIEEREFIRTVDRHMARDFIFEASEMCDRIRIVAYHFFGCPVVYGLPDWTAYPDDCVSCGRQEWSDEFQAINIAASKEGREIVARLLDWADAHNCQQLTVNQIVVQSGLYALQPEHLKFRSLCCFAGDIIRFALGILLVDNGMDTLYPPGHLASGD